MCQEKSIQLVVVGFPGQNRGLSGRDLVWIVSYLEVSLPAALN